MEGRLKLITAPAVEILTPDELKLYSHISHDVEDTIIAGWITYARTEAENFLRQSLISQTWEIIFDNFPCLPLEMPRSPLQSVTSIKYYDTANTEATISATEYFVDSDTKPGRICHTYGYTWPSLTLREINAVKIRYITGYGAAPASIPQFVKEAIMVYCAFRHENRAAETEVPRQFYDILRCDRVHI
jgi:uncharacterized phiE125 gp8 family phage protein